MTTGLPDKPKSREESYLAKIAGEDVDTPEKPESRTEQYLAYIAENGGSGGMSKNNPTGTGKLQVNGVAIGENSVAIGKDATTYGNESFAEGLSDNKALDKTTLDNIEKALTGLPGDLITDWSGEHDKFSLAAGEASHVEGVNCLAIGNHSHAEGNGTIAENNSAHAEGTGSYASGKYSHAGGLETIASNQGAFAHGQRVKATGRSATAFGYNDVGFTSNNASGLRSFSAGLNCIASGEDSVAIGKGIIASDSNRIAMGKYNYSTSGALFIIGNGGGENSRSNAFYVDVQGRAYIKANLTSADNEKALVDLKYLREYAQEYLPNQKVLTTSAQVNSAKEAGFYRVAFTYNLNGEYTYGEMVSIPYESTDTPGAHYGAQLFFANGDYDDGRQNCFWYRTINGSTWNNWVKVDPSKYDLTNITGYSNSGTQVLKNINGTIQWVNE